ncbi:MAG TPA: hypothetical protein VEA81_06785 [Burkholderiaceae bacterium]|nr:hypothetical protein [Burkholderiaceae bacterium]
MADPKDTRDDGPLHDRNESIQRGIDPDTRPSRPPKASDRDDDRDDVTPAADEVLRGGRLDAGDAAPASDRAAIDRLVKGG